MATDADRTTLFREVNDRILETLAGFGVPAEDCEVLCECGCGERLALPAARYDAVRAAAGLYLVASGHEQRFGRVVERAAGVSVVCV